MVFGGRALVKDDLPAEQQDLGAVELAASDAGVGVSAIAQPGSGSRSLAGVAGLVAVATLLSKGFGFLRQTLIAAIFGSGAEYSAFAVAYVLPGFLLILLGGINGPFHSAIVSVLKKWRPGQQPDQDTAPDPSVWLESIATLVGILLCGVAIGLIVGADPLVRLIAPGASDAVHQLAAVQLRIMAPLALLSGLIGIGFGALNAAEHFVLPALSPLLSSATVIGVLVLFGWTRNPYLLAWGVVTGAVAQWVAQIPLQSRLGLGRPRLRFNWGSPAVKTVGLLMLPAVISSGMIHINVYVDMFFASFLPGDRTIGNLGYAQLLVQTPLGILSNMVLVPLMPLYARLAMPDSWPEFRHRIRQGLIVTAILILPVSMLLTVLARPIVQVAYERGRFSSEITLEVAALLSAYGIGMLFYLLRDVVVRIFYALEDGRTPLLVSGLAIGFNALFDWLLVDAFGAPGLALATAGVNGVALVVLAIALERRLHPLPWGSILRILGLLIALTGISGALTLGIWWGWGAGIGQETLLKTIAGASLAGLVGISSYGWGVSQIGIPEVDEVAQRLASIYGKLPLLHRGSR
ncbi:MAG: murein biosynthesis integral membrane protein MurJ [Synechococcaceae cyanobacterium SM2_3_2]|nr:murein biosynthesis integral membrane protein MurJ [Synechococcaceae cyanobacterium SM2_3_2]